MSESDRLRTTLAGFFAALNEGEVDDVMSFYAPEAIVEVITPGPFSGPRRASADGIHQFRQAIPQIRFEILGMILEGRRAAVEVSSVGSLANGQPYENRYHDLFEFDKDGLIVLFREYPAYPAGSQPQE